MAIAPLVDSWNRRLRNLPGPLPAILSPPLGGEPGPPAADFPAAALQVKVDLFLGGAWVDVTSYVYTRDQIQIRRGRADEANVAEPSTCALTLDNRDGRFSPRNPTGPYFGQLTRNTPLRVRVLGVYTSGWRTRFVGEVSAWPQSWDRTVTDVWAPVTASGVLRRLGQGTALQSALYRRLTRLSPAAVAYWPGEDASVGAGVASAVTGVRAMRVQGTPEVAAYDAFPGSAPVLKLRNASLTGNLRGYTATGYAQLRFNLSIPAAGATDGAIVARMYTTGTAARWDIRYNTASSGSLTALVYDSAGGLLQTSVLFTGYNGVPTRVMLELVQSGGVDIFWYAGAVKAGGFQSQWAVFLGSNTIGSVTQVQIDPNKNLDDVAVGHVAVQTAAMDNAAEAGADLVAEYSGWAGETAAARLQRLCREEGLPVRIIGNVASSAALGAQPADTLLNLLNEAATADGGLLFEPRDELGLAYRTRESLYNRGTRATLDFAAHQVTDADPVDDDRYVRNDVTVSRVDGSSDRETLDAGPLSTQAPPAGVGRYTSTVSVSLASDLQLPDQAGWRLHLGTVDEARFPSVAVRRESPAVVASPALSEALLDLDVGDRVDLTHLPAALPPDAAGQGVLGYSETIWQFEHSLNLACAPSSPWSVGVWDDPGSRYSPDTSTLGADAGSGDTSLSVNTTGPLWSHSDGDFDVVVGGERMTVTAVAGTSSPQTFTVTRSVNTVVKTQAAGATVALFAPVVYAL